MTPPDSHSSNHTVPAGPTDFRPVNNVRLIGHVSKALEIKEMPSGDWLGKWTVVVKRPPRDDPADEAASDNSESSGGAATRRRSSFDAIECVTFDLDVIERLNDVPSRSRLEVLGALRRRFRRDQPGQSRYEVEAFAVDVLSIPEPTDKAELVEHVNDPDPEPPAKQPAASRPVEPVTAAG
jgi:single-stranded DNA-binding protein